jgi:hypothetical protein
MLPTLEKAHTPPPRERLLLKWVETVFDARLLGVWEVSAGQMLQLLTNDQTDLGRQVYKVMSSTQAVGIYLAKLGHLFPDRFRRIKRARDNCWRIRAASHRVIPYANGQTQ